MPRRPRRRPIRRRGYRTRFRGRYNRRRRLNMSRSVLPLARLRIRPSRYRLPIGGFPSRRTTVLRYVEDFSLDPGNATNAVQVFSSNNLYDPNYSGGGHQPMYFDNYAQLYSKYKVNSATITFICLSNHIVNTSTESVTSGTSSGTNQFFAANERAARMFILMDNSPTDYPTKLDTLIEEGNPKLRWKYAPQNTSGRMHKVVQRCIPHKLLNLSFKDDTLSALTGAGPSNQIYFICGVDSMPNANADAMRYQVIITYNVTFFDFIQNQTQN